MLSLLTLSQEIARLLKSKDSGHKEALESFIIEDLQSMSDYQIHRTCEYYRVGGENIILAFVNLGNFSV